MIISLDVESGGLDLAHGCLPFLVTWCQPGAGPCYWEWPVDPLTRRPEMPPADLDDIAALIDSAELIYLHNARFDARALAAIDVTLPWSKVRDTLAASHLLESNGGHRLDQLCQTYLGRRIDHFEDEVREVTRACRAVARQRYPAWRLAREGAPGLPSVTESSKRDEDKPWKCDMWLPRAMQARGHYMDTLSATYPDWGGACARYACADSEHTLYLGMELERIIAERGLWAIYEHRLKLPCIAAEMESYGVTARGAYTEATIAEYEVHVAELAEALRAIAAECGHDLHLAEGAALNDSMREMFYGSIVDRCPVCRYVRHVKHWKGEQESPPGAVCPKCLARERRPGPARVALVTERRANLGLKPAVSSSSGNPTLDRGAMADYIQTLPDGPALEFCEMLVDKRAHETALSYMRAYQRFWVPVSSAPDYYRIHASLNPFGTDHLRWSSNSCNMQNVSGESKELSNRACFGPLPDREWWRFDYRQIEARIPAYESGEPALVEVFDRPNDPPYWGSTYNLVASIFYPDEYAPCAQREGAFKAEQPKLYKRAKFFWLARQYGAGKAKGDLLAGFRGASDMVESNLPLLAALQLKYLRAAERLGYVETLPDRTVDPAHGYPIVAARTPDGRVLSTTPFNYHVSSTACWIKNQALIRCSAQCAAWRAEGFDAHVALEVHDELLFDFPRGTRDIREGLEEEKLLRAIGKPHFQTGEADNLWRARKLQKLMESCGADLVPGIPTPVSCEYVAESWAEGVSV